MLSKEIQKNIFDREDAPWAVLPVAYINQYFYQRLPDELRLPFENLNLLLLQWWPEQKRKLHDIYWNEMATCWSVYDALTLESEQQTADVQQLLNGIYVQLFVMQRFEQRLNQTRPLLPNDMNDIDEATFNSILQYYFNHESGRHKDKLLEWVDEFDKDFSADWASMKQKLLEN